MLSDHLSFDKQLFAAVTETWLRDHRDAELNIDGYTLFRQDRNRTRKSRGRESGGVALYIRDDVSGTAEVILNFSSGVIEMIGVQLKRPNLVIIAIYRQPDDLTRGNRSTSVQFARATAALRRTLGNLNQPMPDTIFCGDFNLPHATWPQAVAKTGASGDEKTMINDLSQLCDEFFLTQCIESATHRKGNTLDLVFTNNDDLIHSYTSTPTQMSDHFILECMTTLLNESGTSKADVTPEPERLASLNFHSEKVDWQLMKTAFAEVDWDAELQGRDPESMMERFIDICFHVSAERVPKKRPKAKLPTSKRIPKYRKNLMRKRSRKKKQLAGATSPAKILKIQTELVEIEKLLMISHQQSRDDEEQHAVDSIKRNNKYFYTYAKKYSSTKTGIGPLINSSGDIVDDHGEMANMLAAQYTSVFSTPLDQPTINRQNPANNSSDTLTDITFSESDFVDAIQELNSNSAAGPDGFPAILLKQCKEELAKPLCLIWRKSLDLGTVPRTCKCANIIPIHKGGSKGMAKQYRPIALTSHLVKIFEKVLRRYLVVFLEANGLFNPGQHGFRNGRSCLSQLLMHYEQVLDGLETGTNVDVIYLDFAKAFDKLDFTVTLDKIRNLGIGGKLIKWIQSFLTGREQSVIVNGTASAPTEVVSGVPQGSVVGPLIFLILISDIDSNVNSSFVSSFADDTRIGRKINSVDDIQALQQDLNSVYKWANDNNMQFNCDKFECLKYGKGDLKSAARYTTEDGREIEVKEATRDLGVLISSDGSFSHHINKVCDTGSKLCSWILRTFKTRQRHPMITLWKSLVLPHFDYCCQLWAPDKTGDIQKLERIQKSFLSKISGYRHLNYWELLKALNINSLERRRDRYSIIYTWRMLEKQVPNIGIQEDITQRGRRCIVPPINNAADAWSRRLRESSLSVRGPSLFNVAPRNVRDMKRCKTEQFKAALDEWLNTIPDEPLLPGYTAMRRRESNSVRHMVHCAERGGGDSCSNNMTLPTHPEAAHRDDLGGL